MTSRIILSDMAGVQLLSVDSFDGRELYSNLSQHPIASGYPNLDAINEEQIGIYEFLGWEPSFTQFMTEHNILVLIG